MLVTHNLRLIEQFADRALLLREGRAHAFGSPHDVIGQYEFEVGPLTGVEMNPVVEAAP